MSGIGYLKSLIEKRDELTERHPAFIGRHAFFTTQKPLLEEGIRLVEQGSHDTARLNHLGFLMLKARGTETASHLQRFQTPDGNAIHHAEEEVYSMALDVFKTVAETDFKVSY